MTAVCLVPLYAVNYYLADSLRMFVSEYLNITCVSITKRLFGNCGSFFLKHLKTSLTTMLTLVLWDLIWLYYWFICLQWSIIGHHILVFHTCMSSWSPLDCGMQVSSLFYSVHIFSVTSLLMNPHLWPPLKSPQLNRLLSHTSQIFNGFNN